MAGNSKEQPPVEATTTVSMQEAAMPVPPVGYHPITPLGQAGKYIIQGSKLVKPLGEVTWSQLKGGVSNLNAKMQPEAQKLKGNIEINSKRRQAKHAEQLWDKKKAKKLNDEADKLEKKTKDKYKDDKKKSDKKVKENKKKTKKETDKAVKELKGAWKFDLPDPVQNIMKGVLGFYLPGMSNVNGFLSFFSVSKIIYLSDYISTKDGGLDAVDKLTADPFITIFGPLGQKDLVKSYGQLTSKFVAGITPLAGTVLAIIIFIQGYQLIKSGIINSPKDKGEFLDNAYYSLIMIVATYFYQPIMFCCIRIQAILFVFVLDLMKTIDVGKGNLLDAAQHVLSGTSLWKIMFNTDGFPEVNVGGIIILIAIFLVVLGLIASIYFQFLARAITFIWLYSIGPIMLSLAGLNMSRGRTGAWIKEMAGTLLFQTVQALGFGIVVILIEGVTTAKVNGFVGGIIIIFALFVYKPIISSIQELIGLPSGVMNQAYSKGSQSLMVTGLAAAAAGAAVATGGLSLAASGGGGLAAAGAGKGTAGILAKGTMKTGMKSLGAAIKDPKKASQKVGMMTRSKLQDLQSDSAKERRAEAFKKAGNGLKKTKDAMRDSGAIDALGTFALTALGSGDSRLAGAYMGHKMMKRRNGNTSPFNRYRDKNSGYGGYDKSIEDQKWDDIVPKDDEKPFNPINKDIPNQEKDAVNADDLLKSYLNKSSVQNNPPEPGMQDPGYFDSLVEQTEPPADNWVKTEISRPVPTQLGMGNIADFAGQNGKLMAVQTNQGTQLVGEDSSSVLQPLSRMGKGNPGLENGETIIQPLAYHPETGVQIPTVADGSPAVAKFYSPTVGGSANATRPLGNSEMFNALLDSTDIPSAAYTPVGASVDNGSLSFNNIQQVQDNFDDFGMRFTEAGSYVYGKNHATGQVQRLSPVMYTMPDFHEYGEELDVPLNIGDSNFRLDLSRPTKLDNHDLSLGNDGPLQNYVKGLSSDISGEFSIPIDDSISGFTLRDIKRDIEPFPSGDV